jgi:drug/metabolite transporter (DMT)-like permease
LITSLFIAGYALADGLGARVMGSGFGFYAWLTLLNVPIFVTIAHRLRPGVVGRVWTEARPSLLFGGTASFTAYAIVMWAFTQAPIGLVTALRETSVIFAVLIGVFVLKERLDPIKLAATTVTLAGAALLRFAG